VNDPRTDAIIAAVVARYPGARITVELDPDPDTMRIPVFAIILDGDRDRLHAAEQFAIDLSFETFKDEEIPFFIVATTPEREAKYRRDVAAALQQRATA
jgi:hypothetical protein